MCVCVCVFVEGKSGVWQYPTPDWSEFREDSFGVAGLTIVNESHAFFSWHRHACQSNDPAAYHINFSTSCVTYEDNSEQAMETSDEFWMVRPSFDECSNRYAGSAYEPVDPSSLSGGDNDDDSNDSALHLSTLNTLLGAACIVLLFISIILGYSLHKVMRRGPGGPSLSLHTVDDKSDYDKVAMDESVSGRLQEESTDSAAAAATTETSCSSSSSSSEA